MRRRGANRSRVEAEENRQKLVHYFNQEVNDIRILGHAALISSSAFAGASLYVSLVDNPSRLTISDGQGMLEQWKTMYSKAAPMQAGLALISGAVASTLAYKTGDKRWLVGSALILSNLPYSILCITPVNNELNAIPNELATKLQITDLVEQWGKLHAMMAQKLLTLILCVSFFITKVNGNWDFEKVREYWKILPPHVSDLPKQPPHLPTCKQGAPCGGSPPGAPKGLGLGFYPWGSKQTPCVCPT